MKIMSILLDFTIKDWLIVITSFILILCILEIRKLKKSIAQEIHKRILPQLTLEIVFDVNTADAGFYLKNDSFFIARGIQIEDVALTLDDFGYKSDLILKFEDIDSIKPQEKAKLKFKVFDKNQTFLPEITERIIPHLSEITFKVKVWYSNIENLKSYVVFFKKGKKICIESIKSCQ